MRKSNLYRLAAWCLVPALACCQKKDQEVTPAGRPEATLTATAKASDQAGHTYEVGFANPTGNNKNPFVVKKDAGGNQIWKVVHETSAVDGTATLVTLDGDGHPWVVFTVDGGSAENTSITKSQVEAGAFEGVLFNGYGNGGGPKIAVIARLNPENGKIAKGTFLMCRRDKVTSQAGPQFSGRSISDPNTVTNSIAIDSIGIGSGEVVIKASNTYRPPAAESTQARFVYYPGYDQVATGKIRCKFPIDLSKINAVEILAN